MLRMLMISLFFFSAICAESTKQQEVLNFWFGKLDSPTDYPSKKAPLWYKKDPDFDREIKDRFEVDVIKASKGKYAAWQKTPRGRLALIILLDQFPRNIYRNTPRAFAFDHQAQKLVLDGLALSQDEKLYPIERQFFYIPLMHAEDIQLQNRSLEESEKLLNAVPEKLKPHFSLKWTIRHWEIIQMFGRFPHRNAILKRPSTAQEKIFLTLPGSSF